MVSKGLALIVESAENGTNDIPTFSLDELNRCRGQLLGGGAFGKVYAINSFPGLAMKEIYLSGQQDRLKEIIRFELEALSRFSHPGVLKYHQVLANGDFLYIIMDRYDGDLQHFIADHRKTQKLIPRELMLFILRQLASALAYVHNPTKVDADGNSLPAVVHRDLKPANVLMSKNGERVVIADFGLCKDAQHDGSTFAGSPSYMAPEVFIHQKTSRASDIWALGVIIYELATLELPSFSRKWEPEDAKEFFILEWKPDLSAVEDDFIKMVLEKIFVLDPIERPTAKELADRLRTLNTSAGEPGDQDPVSDESRRSYIISDSSSSKISFSWTPLIRAITDGDIKAVKRHLSKKGKKSTGDDIALMIAARAGYADIVELLDPTDERGITALMRAAERGDVEAARALIPLQKGKTARYIKINGWLISHGTALMMAATRGHTEVVELLVEHEGSMQDSWGWTALMLTARNGHIDCIKLLLEKEACMQNKNGLTALMSAARNSRIDCVKLLLEKEVGIQDNQGWTALMFAACNNKIECVELLREKEKGMQDNYGMTTLMHAAEKGHTECAQLLLKEEACIKDASGKTALMWAALNGSVGCVRLLLEKQGRMQDENGRTALMHAAESGQTEAVKVLLEHEKGMKDNQNHNALYHALKNERFNAAKVIVPHEDPTDEDGVTALMRATARGDAEMVELLIPIQKEMKDKDGSTAFFHALKNKHEGIATVLRKHEAPSWTPLMCAAVTGDIETAKQHLSDKDKKNDDGDTALMIAARAGHEDIVELLDPTDRDGVTALIRAADRNDVEVVMALIPLQKRETAWCVNANESWIYRGTALMIAATRGHTEVVRLLVKHEGGMEDDAWWTALMFAAKSGHADCAQLLLEKEAGMKDKSSKTALMAAAENGHADCAELLLKKEVYMQNIDGVTALMLAARNGHAECTKLLLEKEYGMKNKDRWTALMWAAQDGYVDCVRLLVEKESGIQNKWGVTALMCAARNGHAKAVRLLIERESNIQNRDGKTALMLVARNGHPECIELLLNKEACMQDKNGMTALMCAAQDGQVDCVKLLVEKERGQKDKQGQTALILAAERRRDEAVRLLMVHEGKASGWTSLMYAAYRGDIDTVKNDLHMKGGQDISGWTALMRAAYHGYIECVKLLLEKESGMQNKNGWTALMYATYSNKLDCVKLLAEKEKDIKTTREWSGYQPGSTALNIAIERGHTEIISILRK